MKVRIYRNLDKPFELFGIKGKFIAVAGIAVVACVMIALLVGVTTNTYIGIGTAALLLALSYLGITQVQSAVGDLAIQRRLAALSIPKFVIVNSKVWKQ